MDPGTEPIADDELLYRRISMASGWYEPARIPPLNPEAFRPNKKTDESGLSLWRAKYVTAQEAARGPSGKPYYVAVLSAADLRAKGIEIVPRPLPGQPGHAEIPALTSANRSDQQAKNMSALIAEKLCLRFEGPFPQPEADT